MRETDLDTWKVRMGERDTREGGETREKGEREERRGRGRSPPPTSN